MGTILRFVKNYCAAFTKKYWALGKGEILYKSNFCKKFLHLKKFQCVNIKNNCQFLVGHVHVSQFTFIKFRP